MAQVPPRAVHPHWPHQRDLWDSLTSAVGDVFEGDKDATTTAKNTAKNDKTTVKTVLTTDTPKGYTGPLTTKTPAKATAKTTAATTTAKQTTSTKAAAAPTTTSKTTAKTPTSTTLSTAATSTKAAAKSTAALTMDTAPAPQPSTVLPTTSAASATATASPSHATSAGAKAGIAIGVLAGVFFVAMAIFLLVRRRRNKAERQRIADDEKTNGPFADSAAIGGVQKPAPRLSLRPVTQLFGGGALGAGAGAGAAAAAAHYDSNRSDRPPTRGNAIALQNQPPMNSRAWERPSTSSGNNPFGDGAQRLGADANGVSPVGPGAGAAAFAAGAGAGAGAGAVAGGALTRKASTRKDGPGALDLTLNAPRHENSLGPVPPSPAGTEYSMNSAAPGQTFDASSGSAAIAAAGGPAVSTVHRVQLDFKPTLEDELGLRAGQLVRLLHEYDDGWALCIRLDRSQQGVVPRTCLSTRPVKPRPPQGGGRPGPPVHPNGRPMTPQSGPGRMGPGPMGGPMGGMGRPQSPAGRPHTPQGSRGPSPAPHLMNNQPRPQSPFSVTFGAGRPASPAGSASAVPAPGMDAAQPQPPVELPGAVVRPQSPSGMAAPAASPAGPSPISQQMRQTNSIGRKPVPGQAL